LISKIITRLIPSILAQLAEAKFYIDSQDDIDAIVEKVLFGDEDRNRAKYFDPIQANSNALCLHLAVKGVFCTMTSALSDAYPIIETEVRTFYTSSPLLPAFHSQYDKSTASLVHDYLSLQLSVASISIRR